MKCLSMMGDDENEIGMERRCSQHGVAEWETMTQQPNYFWNASRTTNCYKYVITVCGYGRRPCSCNHVTSWKCQNVILLGRSAVSGFSPGWPEPAQLSAIHWHKWGTYVGVHAADMAWGGSTNLIGGWCNSSGWQWHGDVLANLIARSCGIEQIRLVLVPGLIHHEELAACALHVFVFGTMKGSWPPAEREMPLVTTASHSTRANAVMQYLVIML